MPDSCEPTVTFSLTVKDGVAALDFYTKAFGAEEIYRLELPDGGLAHGEFKIGNTRIYISGEDPDMHAFAAPEDSLSASSICISVEDCDAAFAKAVEAGARPLTEPKDDFWGVRGSQVVDPFGVRWHLGQKIEEVSPEELTRRAKELMGG